MMVNIANFTQEEFDSYLHHYIDHQYSNIPSELLNNRDFILAALQATEESSHHFYFQDHIHLIEDKDIVMAALANKTFTLDHIRSSSLYSDVEVLEQAMNHHADNLQFMPTEWLENREWIKNLLQEDGSYFEYICDLYGEDREIVLLAAESYGYTLHHMSPVFLNDREIVTLCVLQNDSLASQIGEELSNDFSFHLFILDNMLQYQTVCHFSEAMRNHDELMSIAMKKNPMNYAYLSDRLKYNLNYLQSALSTDISIYQSIPYAMSKELSSIIFGKNEKLYIHQDNYQLFLDYIHKICLTQQLSQELSVGQQKNKSKI